MKQSRCSTSKSNQSHAFPQMEANVKTQKQKIQIQTKKKHVRKKHAKADISIYFPHVLLFVLLVFLLIYQFNYLILMHYMMHFDQILMNVIYLIFVI